MNARASLAALCAIALASASPAQVPAASGDPEEAQRMQRALQQNRAEVERLLDLRVRHDLGLPTADAEPTFRSGAAATTESMERMQRQLREEDAATRSLRDRFEHLHAEVERLRAEAAARAQREQAAHAFVDVPTPGSRVGGAAAGAWPQVSAGADPASGLPRLPAPAPAGESAAGPHAGELGPIVRDPLRAQIHGSDDHLRVAQALFKAGQALMDRGDVVRAQGAVDAAKELDERARERLVRAVDELQPLLARPEPPFVALFYLGRTRELLFRYSERHEDLSLATSPREFQRREQEVRDPFLSISARDVRKTGERGDVEVLGEWGQAAQTAMEHFRWMNLHGGYDARAAIEALTWPGERER